MTSARRSGAKINQNRICSRPCGKDGKLENMPPQFASTASIAEFSLSNLWAARLSNLALAKALSRRDAQKPFESAGDE